MNNNRHKMSGNNLLPSIDKIFKEEDDDFTPSVGSNLAAIFGGPQKVQDNTRVNLPARHASSKQSAGDQNQSQASAAAKKEVILAKAVHAFKLQNGQYVAVGKVGLALIGNPVARQYDVILYKGTQDYISIVGITSDFAYTLQANNYASYYDADKHNWSILFDNAESSAQFAREVCLSRYYSRSSRIEGSIVYQDLSAAGKDTSAKEGDSISIKYLTSTDMSQPMKIDNNLKETITLEISKDDNWERLLVGTSMGLRRMMILSPNKQIGLGPGFPKDRDVIMEIEVVSVFAKEELPPPITKPPEVSQKATIISRMAKMGQSILPKLQPSTTTDSEDTEEEVFHKTARHKRVESSDSSLPKKHSHSSQPSDSVSQRKGLSRGELVPAALPITQRPVLAAPVFAPQWTQAQIQQQYVNVDGQLVPIQQQTIAQPIPASIDPSLNVFLSETRTQNTELRMGISKINDKVQKLLDKFHVFELQQASTPPGEKSLEATLRMLMDVNKSKENVETKDRNVQCALKTEEAPQDESLLSINRELNSKLNITENELKQANESLATKSKSVDELNRQNDSLKQANSKLSDQVKELETKLSASEAKHEELSDEIEKSKGVGSKFQEENLRLENRLAELAKKCREMEQSTSKSETSDWVDKSKDIKGIMSQTFQELCEAFSEESYPTDYIKSTIRSTIREITFRFVSQEAERKKEQAIRIKDEANESMSDQKMNESSGIIDNDIREDVPALSNDIVNSSMADDDTVSEFRKEPPPVPKFYLDAVN